MNRIMRITLNGYKSFRFGEDEETRRDNTLEFGPITVLLGANGAGKSNIISFFGFLRALAFSSGRFDLFQEYLARKGGPNDIFHFGTKETPNMEFEVVVEGKDAIQYRNYFENKDEIYRNVKGSEPPDNMSSEKFLDEMFRGTVTYTARFAATPQNGLSRIRQGMKFVSMAGSTVVGGAAEIWPDVPVSGLVHGVWSRLCNDLSFQFREYQFDDTSERAPIRRARYKEDAGELLSDAGNLAAYLYSLQLNHEKYYQRIVERVRQVCPQFGEFVLKPSVEDNKNVLLNWKERNRPDYLFGPHQLSDGTLRFIALTTLFLQPPEMLPSVIVVDEPELGLHPYAITALAGMAKAASQNCQVVLATQSTRLVDEFDVEQIRVIDYDRQKNCSLCRRPDPEALKEWIAEYTTSELWEKNVFGGRP